MQQIDGSLPTFDHVFFAQFIGTPANIAPRNRHVQQEAFPQILFDLFEGSPAFRRRDQSLCLDKSKCIAQFNAVQGQESKHRRVFCHEGMRGSMVAIVSINGNEEAAVGVSIRGHLFYSLRAFQKASVSRLVDFLPTAGFSANRLAQLTPLAFLGEAGDRVANVAPWRVMATGSPSSIHLATSAK